MKVADHWFARERVDDRITRLWEPHVARVFQCNIWHVRGRDRDLLIDAGMGLSSLKRAIASLIDKPMLAVATHSHLDHMGSLHEFSHRLAHPLEIKGLEQPEDFPLLCSHHWPLGLRTDLQQAGYEVPECLIDALPEPGFDPLTFRTPPTTATRLLNEGDIIDLGDIAFEVLHLPGHSPGSIGLWEPNTGTLFSGDAIYNGPLLDNFPDSDIDDYIHAMRRLITLPVNIVHAGHDPSFDANRLRILAKTYLNRH